VSKTSKTSKRQKVKKYFFFHFRGKQIHKKSIQIYGISYQGTVCHPDLNKRVLIIEWHDSDDSTAYVLAHEIGHSLDIQHDFMSHHGILKPRYDLGTVVS
jgi:Zn-dependent peptidase ImmA (M78 family)